MSAPEKTQGLYEELADRCQRRGDPRHRDIFLALAADAALANGRVDQAERLRRRLLQFSPHNLLSPFASFAEAMLSDDIREYLLDLRQQFPPDKANKLLQDGAPPSGLDSPFGHDIYGLKEHAPPVQPYVPEPPLRVPTPAPPLAAKPMRRSPYENPDYGPRLPAEPVAGEFTGTWIVFVLVALVALLGLLLFGYVLGRPFVAL